MGFWRSLFGVNKKRVSTELGKNGEKIYRYPSGYVAAVISGEDTDRVSSFFEDSVRGRLLCSFNHEGVGDIYFENGTPRVSVTTKDCTFFDANGNVKKRWTWPRLLSERVELQLGERLHVTLIDRQHITVKLRLSSKNDKVTEFECGESQHWQHMRAKAKEPERATNTLRTVQRKGKPAAVHPEIDDSDEEETHLPLVTLPNRTSSLPARPLTLADISPDITPHAPRAPPELPPERGLLRSQSEGGLPRNFRPLLKAAAPYIGSAAGLAIAGLLFVASRGGGSPVRGVARRR